MRNIYTVVLMLAMSSGCWDMVNSPPKPGQAEALRRLATVMGPLPLDRMAIEWIEGDRLNCANGTGFLVKGDVGCETGKTCPQSNCSGGHTDIHVVPFLDDTFEIKLAAYPGWTWETSPLPHEICHVVYDDEFHAHECQYSSADLSFGRKIPEGRRALAGLSNTEEATQ